MSDKVIEFVKKYDIVPDACTKATLLFCYPCDIDKQQDVIKKLAVSQKGKEAYKLPATGFMYMLLLQDTDTGAIFFTFRKANDENVVKYRDNVGSIFTILVKE